MSTILRWETFPRMAAQVKAPWDFCGVFLTLDNVLLPEEKLTPTPSMQDGLDTEIEQDLRILGCEFIQTAGILLKLPQVSLVFSFTLTV